MVSTIDLKPEVVLDYKCLLGEGPVWDSQRNVICWIDILNGNIHQYSPESKKHETFPMGQMIGSFSICTNGNFLAALKNGFAFVDRQSGSIENIIDPESDKPGNRFNDGKCDPQGRFWAGTLALSEEKGAGSLYTLDRDLTVTKKLSDVTISNGLAWTGDQQTLYYIDTPTSSIFSFSFEKDTGKISDRKVIIKIPTSDGYPDGMSIDAEGMLWIAHWDGWQLSRWNPSTGEKLLKINMPVARVTSCTFGGDNFEDLYITTARKELTEEQLAKQPLAGSLFVIKKSGFKGVRAIPFDVVSS
ncbi:MAG: SMP-30/gluconolactonase/LRE family protein [Cyclobacteriaceae bacterium]|nr:SMP-30/gluconolactonase/LRE family protein [Cyclobacteriaceae bacterium]